MQEKIKDNRVLYLSIFYTIAFFMLLVNYGGVYWDDWAIYNQPFSAIEAIVTETGQWLLAYPLHYILHGIGNGVYVYHLFTFFAFLISSILLLKVLDSISDNKLQNFILILLFALVPLNSARVTIVCTLYSASFLLYSTFFYLYNCKRDLLWAKLISYCFLFLSFTTNSFLAFHFALFLVFLHTKGELGSLGDLLKVIKKHLVIVILPFVYFAAKLSFFKPTGAYLTYNKITAAGLLKAIPLSFKSVLYSLKNINALAEGSLVIIFVIFLLTYFVMKNWKLEVPSNKTSLRFIVGGLVLLFFANFSYATVGKLPIGPSINSRFELLVPFGLSLFIYGFICLVSSKSKGRFSISLLSSLVISAFIFMNMTVYTGFTKFWMENAATEHLFSQSEEIKGHTSFMAHRETLSYSKGVRKSFSFYELAGISKKLYGVTDKLFSPQVKAERKPFPHGTVPNLTKSRLYLNVGNYQDKDYEYLLTLKQDRVITTKYILRFWRYNLFNSEKRNSYLTDFYSLDIKDLKE